MAQPAQSADDDPRPAMALEVVSFGYHAHQPVLDQVSGELATGRLTVMIGPNAAGKTTLVKLMLGLHWPWQGQVILPDPTARQAAKSPAAGHRVDKLSPSQRAQHLVYVPQRGSVQFAFTVRQVVSMGRFAFAESASTTRAVVDRVMQWCRIEALANRVVGQLSGGQQQRVTLARAFVQAQGRLTSSNGRKPRGSGAVDSASLRAGVCESEPGQCAPGSQIPALSHEREAAHVMLLDEPASNMDLWHAHRTLAMLGQWVHAKPAKRAALVVLHDLNLAMRWADDVWLMDHGRMLAAGPWHEVLSPAQLEPIYGMKMQLLNDKLGGARPVLQAEPSATILD